MQRKTLVVGGVAILGAGILAVVAVAVLPMFLHDRIVAAVNAEAMKRLEADVSIGGVEVSLLRTFPRLGVRVSDVAIVGHAPFAGIPLAKVAVIDLGLDLGSVISGTTLEIRTLSISQPEIQIVVLEDGKINTDIVVVNEPKEAVTEAPPTSWDLELADLIVTDLDLSYDDREGGTGVRLADLDTRSSGDLSQTVSRFETATTIGSLTVESGGVTWLKDTKWNAEVDVDYDATTGGMTFGDNQVAVNALLLGFAGSLVPSGDDWDLDLTFDSRDTSFKTLLSLVPSAYSGSFAGVETSGTVGLKGSAVGKYKAEGDHLPAFELAVTVTDARFKYPDLPTAVERIALDLQIHHPEGPTDLTELDLKRLAFSAAGATMEGTMKVAFPTTDPLVDAKFAGQVDLQALGTALPQAEGAVPPSGKLDVDVAFAGRASDFVAPNVDKIKASGTVAAQGLRYEGLAVPIVVEALDLALSPQRADLRGLRVTYGEGSDLAANGHFDNLLGYGLGDGTLTGELAITSKHLDLRPFEGGDEPTPEPAPTDEAALVAVPTDVAITLTADLGEVVTDEFTVDAASGTLDVRDGAVRLDRFKASMLGGEATMSGTYAAPTANEADVDLAVDTVRFDLAKTLASFETLARIAPLLEGASGRFDSGFSVATKLGPDGTPDLSILSSAGQFTPSGVIVKPAVLAEIGRQLGNSNLSAIDLGGATVRYAFERGRVELSPISAKLGTVPAKISGSAGVLDRTLDLSLDLAVPTNLMAGAPVLANVTKALGRTADVTVHLTGSWDAPKVSVGLEGIESVVDAVKAVAGQAISGLVAEARKQGDALIAAATKQAASLKTAAKTAGDRLRAEAKTQGDKLVRDAKNPIQEIGAKEAAKVLASEADKAAKKGEAEAAKAADAAIAEAKKKKDQLIADAEKKARSAVR